MLDYPGKTACIVWFAGCNMACSYCYNPEIVTSKGQMTYEEVLTFLEKRKGLLDAVVLSGGESTRAKEIVEFTKRIKNLGFLVKLDTNGSMPHIVDEMLGMKLIDYVALDFKSLLGDFYRITKSKLFSRFEIVLKRLIESDVAFEVRTTFHDSVLCVSDLEEMCKYLVGKKYQGNYYIQHYFNGSKTIGSLNDSHVRLEDKSIESFGLKVEIRN